MCEAEIAYNDLMDWLKKNHPEVRKRFLQTLKDAAIQLALHKE